MNRIDDQAVTWVAREDRGILDEATATRRDAWLARDPRHAGAYARARAALADMDRASALGKRPDLQAFAPTRRWRRRMAPFSAIAATLACLLIGFAAWQASDDRYATGLGEVRRIPLQDGSTVTLNSDSVVVVDLDRHQRNVVLERGEALFDVAKDPQRPFVVHAGSGQVTAVGTSFSVQRVRGDQLRVLVREGVVKVAEARSAPVRVVANSAAIARPGAAIDVAPMPEAELRRRLVWRDGMIAFDGDTLAQAAAEFARYSDTRILIDDPQVAGRRVVGLYSATDPAGFARAVATSLGLRAEATRDGIYLRRDTRGADADGGRAPPAHQLL